MKNFFFQETAGQPNLPQEILELVRDIKMIQARLRGIDVVSAICHIIHCNGKDTTNRSVNLILLTKVWLLHGTFGTVFRWSALGTVYCWSACLHQEL